MNYSNNTLGKPSKNKIVNSFFWAIIDKGGVLIIQFVALVVLSRLLTPYDFGIIGILTIFINVSLMIIDSGMVGALIGKREVTDEDFSTLFMFNLGLSLFIYLVFYITAPVIASFYQIAELTHIIRILMLSIVFSAFGLIQMIKLTRAYRFKLQSYISIISQTTSVIFAIFMAENGYGVWSLITMQVLQTFLNSAILFFTIRYIPVLKFSNKSFLEQFRFGIPLLFANLLFVINNSITSSVLGKLFSPTKTGYYSQSIKLQSVPTGIITAVVDKVGFTILSKQDNPLEIKNLGGKINKYIYLISFPLFIFVTIVSEPLLILILGNKWSDASWIFKVLTFSLIPVTMKILNRNILKSTGKTNLILKMELTNVILFLTILFVATLISFEAIIYGVVISNFIMAIISLFFIKTALQQSIKEQISIFLKPLLISVSLYIFTVIISNYLNLTGFFNIWITGILFFCFVLLVYLKTKIISFKNVLK